MWQYTHPEKQLIDKSWNITTNVKSANSAIKSGEIKSQNVRFYAENLGFLVI